MSACQILFEHTNPFVFLDLHRRREARCRFSLQDGSKIKYEEAERDRNDRLRLGVATSPIMLCPYRRSRHDGRASRACVNTESRPMSWVQAIRPKIKTHAPAPGKRSSRSADVRGSFAQSCRTTALADETHCFSAANRACAFFNFPFRLSRSSVAFSTRC